jgi:hypothetical protein
MEKYAIDTESLDKLLSDSKKVRLLDVRRKIGFLSNK